VALPLGVLHEGSIGSGVATIGRPARRGSFSEMPNIKQQEKRVRQAARQRQENLRWRSSAKTLMRRLRDAVEGGDAQEAEARHRELVQLLDRAASHGALHRNTVARRKSQAANIAAGKSQ
jgi:small subunit ribosomal protein S20